jgi:hypothetical protein
VLVASAWLLAAPAANAGKTAHVAVVNGTPISVQQAPWQVAVEARFHISPTLVERVSCSGSIIDVSHVLTAAHCVFKSPTERLPPEDFAVLAGSSDLSSLEAGEELRAVTSVRAHPYYAYSPNSGHAEPDDIAVLTLAEPLQLGPAVSPISLTPLDVYPAEGTAALFSGFGEQNPESKEADGKLYSLPLTLTFSRECGGEEGAANAVLLCAIGPSGSPCEGDSGSAVTAGSNPVQIGVMDDVAIVSGKSCAAGSRNVSANVAAPEIQDFIEGSEAPPQAPRGGGASCPTVEPVVGSSMTCQGGAWSNGPSFSYQFLDSASGQVLQSGPSSTYKFSTFDVGHSLYMQVLAANPGGTGVDRTVSTTQVVPRAPSGSKPAKSLGRLSLLGTSIVVQGSGNALMKIHCPSGMACRGALSLTARRKGKGGHARTITLGTVKLSLKAGRTTVVKIKLNASGRALLAAAHGRLSAHMTLVQAQPAPRRTLNEGVHLLASR